MKAEAGSNAFDNIDDLLADKIADHSARHSDYIQNDRSENEMLPSDSDDDFPFSVIRNLALFAGIVVIFIGGLLYLKKYVGFKKR